MKKILLASLILITTTFANAQAKPVAQPAPAVASDAVFKETKHSFGKIKQNVPATYVFTVKNTGSKPLIIENAQGSCGCTKPEYSTQPILKGKSTTIKVTYNAATVGTFNKTVTVKFLNVATPTVLTIDGEVLKTEEKKP